MGMRARKHAIVVVLPTGTSPRDVQERHVAAMQRAVREYVTLAQSLQPRENGDSGADRSPAHEATRLLVSLTAFVGNGTDMARAIALSAHASHAPRQLCAKLEDEVKKWRQRGDGGEDGDDDATGDGGSRCGAFVTLLEELAAQQFNVSVLAPADALPVSTDVSWTSALQKQTTIQFVLLRDEDEQSDIASRNMLLLLRGVKNCSRRQCSVRQAEDFEVELEGVVKEWLHAAVPVVRASLSLQNDERPMEMEIRANFVLLDQLDGILSSTSALPSYSSKFALIHFVPLASVHPALLMGCPLRASAIDGRDVRVYALSRFLRSERRGALLRSSRADGARVFYLLVASPGSDNRMLFMYRVAAAEEVLLQESETKTSDEATQSVGEEYEERVAEETDHLRALPMRDFNPFRNRSGILATASTSATSSGAPQSKRTQKSVSTARSVSAKPNRVSVLPSTARGLPLVVTSSARPKKKRRL